MDKNLTTRGIIPGITGYVSAPCKYTVNYINGSIEYNEKFAVINIGKEYTGDASKQIDVIIDSASAALAATVGAATGGLGLALGPLANIALHWIKDQIFNPDGSVTLLLAYHNIGTKNFGIDPTFWPGGLEPNVWNGIVDAVCVAVSAFGSKYDDVTFSAYAEIQNTKGKYSEALPVARIELVKEFYSRTNFLDNAFSRNSFSIPDEEFLRLGLPILANNDSFNLFVTDIVSEFRTKGRSNDLNVYMLNCVACKTVAYSIAGVLVAMGAVAALTLTTTSSIVVSLASALGVSTTQALACILGVASFIGYGADKVASGICESIGYC